MRFRKRFICSLALLMIPFSTGIAQTSPPLVVRVGVISYEDFGKTFEEYKGIFARLMKPAAGARPVMFRITVGTYGDVLAWYNRNLIDLAILTPEPVAELISSTGGADTLRDLYIATRATTPIKGEPKYDYRSFCVVGNSSPLHSFDDIREWARHGRVKFLFVHPLSVSGSILPRYLLAQRGITNVGPDVAQANDAAPLNPLEWTFSHDRSLDMLAVNENNLHIDNPKDYVQVAFVSERDLKGKGRVLAFPELDEKMIPQEVLLISKKFAIYKQFLKDLFIQGSPKGEFKEVDNWLEQFQTVKEWVKAIGVSSHDVAAQRISLTQIGENLRNFESRYHKPARLALVLSGGGAKCSYQLGAIEALESELEIAPETASEKKVDIDLVVGTSGGAINALCVALGLTRTLENQRELEKTWENFDQKIFFHPWGLVRILLGILVACLEALLFMRLILWRTRKQREIKTGVALIVVAVLNFALMVLAWNPPWNWMGGYGRNHYLHHFWLIGSLNLDISAYFLLAAGALLLIIAWKSPRADDWLEHVYNAAKTFVAIWVIGLIWVTLFAADTLSKSEGVEKSLAQRLPALLNHHPDVKSRIELPAAEAQPLQFISNEIMKQGLLKRDLIITGSRLSVMDGRVSKSSDVKALPDDLYFYYDHKSNGVTAACGRASDAELPADTRFLPFESSLLDVVIGSSSIYPFFPSRRLSNLLSAEQGDLSVEIIDGGFAHNSPIEAAVLWGATHIILIEASPEVSPTRQNFLDNTIAAFNHLYIQAQLVDAHSRGKVEIYSLRPAVARSGDVPNLCVFDFSDILIRKAIADGRRDALNENDPQFRRESGEPSFRELAPTSGCN